MKKFLTYIMVAVLFSPLALADSKINIFACEPEWAALGKTIGGEKVEVFTAISAFQNPHYIKARPSLISAIRNADLVFCSGADLEIGWLPLLLQKSPPSTQFGKAGNFMAADYVDRLEIPTHIDRSMGDIHPEGNPHVHLDPNNILKIANALSLTLARLDEKNKAFYFANLDKFSKSWNDNIGNWQDQAKDLKNLPVISYHNSFAYLFNWLDLNLTATIEDKPGIPPSSRHLTELIQIAQNTKTRLIIITPFDDKEAAEWLRDKTSIPICEIPFTVDNYPLDQLFSKIIDKLNNCLHHD